MSKRKAYRPKKTVVNTMSYVMGGLKKMDSEHLVNLNVSNHFAITDMVQGRGNKDSWDRLCGAFNMAVVMSEQGIGSNHRDSLLAGQDALFNIGIRFKEISKFTVSGNELKLMNEAMSVHDAQLEVSRIIDIERAFDEVNRRLKHRINTKKVMN